jgi:hypothetical protein
VEVIGHHAEGEDADAAEAFAFAEEADEELLFRVVEGEAPFHDAGEAVVEADRSIGGDLQASRPHGAANLPARRHARQAIFYKKSVPL